MELYSGNLLFPAKESLQHLCMIEKIVGCRIPTEMLMNSKLKELNEVVSNTNRCIAFFGQDKKQEIEKASIGSCPAFELSKKIRLDLNQLKDKIKKKHIEDSVLRLKKIEVS